MARPSILSYSSVQGTGNSVYIPLPSGVNSGDFMLGALRSNQTEVHSIPSGWTSQELFIFEHGSGSQSINACSIFYKTYDNEASGISLNIESGAYVGALLAIQDTLGIDTVSYYNSGLSCFNTLIYGTKVNYTGGLSIDIFGAMSALNSGNLLTINETPFNGTYHSGVSLSISYLDIEYSVTGTYTPPSAVARASGSPFLNSGNLYYYPPTIYYCGASIYVLPTG